MSKNVPCGTPEDNTTKFASTFIAMGHIHGILHNPAFWDEIEKFGYPVIPFAKLREVLEEIHSALVKENMI